MLKIFKSSHIRLRLHGTGQIWIRYEIRTVQFCLHCAVFILIPLFLRLHGTGQIWMRYEIRTVQFCLHCAVFILIPLFLRLHGTDIYTLAHAQNSCRENSKWLPEEKKKKRKSARQSDTESVPNGGEKNFSWTDEEMALLLQVIMHSVQSRENVRGPRLGFC